MVVALVGDVVQSRNYRDQSALLHALTGLVERVNEAVPARQPLRLVVRDEFQATYDGVAQAVEAALRLRLAAGDVALATIEGPDGEGEHEPLDVRVGLGEGEVILGDGHSPDAGQTGSAWWAAREALEQAFELPRRSQWPPSIRVVHRGPDPARQGAVNAYLLCQDQLFARMDLRDRRALRGLLDGERQVDVAAELGITQPAVARRLRDRGALAIKRGLEALHEADARSGTAAAHPPAVTDVPPTAPV